MSVPPLSTPPSPSLRRRRLPPPPPPSPFCFFPLDIIYFDAPPPTPYASVLRGVMEVVKGGGVRFGTRVPVPPMKKKLSLPSHPPRAPARSEESSSSASRFGSRRTSDGGKRRKGEKAKRRKGSLFTHDLVQYIRLQKFKEYITERSECRQAYTKD